MLHHNRLEKARDSVAHWTGIDHGGMNHFDRRTFGTPVAILNSEKSKNLKKLLRHVRGIEKKQVLLGSMTAIAEKSPSPLQRLSVALWSPRKAPNESQHGRSWPFSTEHQAFVGELCRDGLHK